MQNLILYNHHQHKCNVNKILVSLICSILVTIFTVTLLHRILHSTFKKKTKLNQLNNKNTLS